MAISSYKLHSLNAEYAHKMLSFIMGIVAIKAFKQ